jgi:hypothetical protein
VKAKKSNARIVKAKTPINLYQHLPQLVEVQAELHLLPAGAETDILPEVKNIPAVCGF